MVTERCFLEDLFLGDLRGIFLTLVLRLDFIVLSVVPFRFLPCLLPSPMLICLVKPEPKLFCPTLKLLARLLDLLLACVENTGGGGTTP